MELLGGRPVWSMSGGDLLSTLDQLDAELARLQTYRLQVISGLDEIGYADEVGAHDTVQLLAFRYRLDRAAAHRDVRCARALPKYAAVSAALPHVEPGLATDAPEDCGSTDEPTPADSTPADEAAADGAVAGGGRWFVRPAQAEAIVSALERVPTSVPVEDIAVAEQQLVNLAAHLTPSELRKAGKEIGDLLDSDGPEPDEHKAHAREALTLSTAGNGVTFRGFLANENAELLRALIHAGARPHKTLDGELDPRPRDKRQADALTAALTIAAAATDTSFTPPNSTTPTAVTATTTGAAAETVGAADRWVPGFGAKANITVTIDLDDLKAATAGGTGQLVYGDALSAAAIRRLACDAKVIPLVLGSNSEPLDVGRSERLVTRAMRRALNARDRGCVVCGAPPIQCDAHHLHSWLDGGATAIWNLALLCRRHHIDLHAGHWTISIANGTVHVSRPTWADPPPNPHPRSQSQATPPRHVGPAEPPAPERPPQPGPAACLTPERTTAANCTVAPDRTALTTRWVADEENLRDAARFAVWGGWSTANQPATPSRPGRPATSSRPSHADPSGGSTPVPRL